MKDLKLLAVVDSINLTGWLVMLHIDMPTIQNIAIITALTVNVLTIGKLVKETFLIKKPKP